MNGLGSRTEGLRRRWLPPGGSDRDRDRSQLEDLGAQAGPVRERVDHTGLGLGFEIRTRLAEPDADAEGGPHPEPLSHQVIQRDAGREDVAARLRGREVDPG